MLYTCIENKKRREIMQHSKTKQLTLSALFLALALALPFLTGQIPQIGSMLSPMHFPVFMCALIVGGRYGMAVGFISPILRSLIFGMPPLFPVAIAMAFEMAIYGLVASLIYFSGKRNIVRLYASLITAMIAGRIVWGIVQFILLSATGGSFTFQMFLSGALLSAIPGIVAQLIIVPIVVKAVEGSSVKRKAEVV